MRIKVDLKRQMKLFQLSYTSLKDFYESAMFMFTARNRKQILRAIIISYSIKMVNYPAFRDWFAMCFLPNQSMFSNVAQRVSSWMLGFFNQYITLIKTRATIPFPMFLASWFIYKEGFWGSFISEFQVFRYCPSRQSSFPKQLVHRRRSTFGAITEVATNFSQCHFFIPMHIQEFLVGYRGAYIYSCGHTYIVPHMGGLIQCAFG